MEMARLESDVEMEMAMECEPRAELASLTKPTTPPARKRNRNLIFHISLLYNLIRHHRVRRPWWTRIEPRLILGALPIREKNHMELLLQTEGVQAIVTMNGQAELGPNFLGTPITPEEWAAQHIPQCFGNTVDFTAPSIETISRCVAFIEDNINRGHTTYVHCKAGRGRSTVVVLAYLMKHEHLSLDDAHARVRAKRGFISLHPKQRRILTEYAELIADTEGEIPTNTDSDPDPDQA